ncbi:MAG TPA: antibiotic biosynthesis monooxygenase [Candidatus Thermoplasmatota archaeon]
MVKHSVKDYATWKAVFEAGSGSRKAAGCKDSIALRASKNPNEVTVLNEWDSVENARKFVESPEMTAAMEKAGVTGHSEVTYFAESLRTGN